MLPDSTVTDSKKAKKKRKSDKDEDTASSKKTKKKSEPVRKKPLKKKVKRKAEDEDYGSDMDLGKELYPISHYIKDRKQLIRQMFTSLKKAKVKSMLPDILQDYSLDEIEQLCYEQIQVMSRKRITALVNGKKADEISSSGTDDNSSDSDDITVLQRVELDPPDSTSVTNELLSLDDCSLVKVKRQSLTAAMGVHKPANTQKLEILELEMRARAIKKMLMSQQADAESDDDIQEVVFSKRRIEDEIRKHMACDQPSTSSAGTHPTSSTAVEEDPPKPAKKPVRRRTESEMEPGELSDEDYVEAVEEVMLNLSQQVVTASNSKDIAAGDKSGDLDDGQLTEYGPEEPKCPEKPEANEEPDSSEVETSEDNVVEDSVEGVEEELSDLESHQSATNEPTNSIDDVKVASVDEESTAKEEGPTAEREESTAKGEESTTKGEESSAEREEPSDKQEESAAKGEGSTTKGEESTAAGEESCAKREKSEADGEELLDGTYDNPSTQELAAKEGSEGEISSSESEVEKDEPSLPETCDQARDSGKEASPATAEPNKCEDIFVDDTEAREESVTTKDSNQKSVESLSLAEVEVVNSALYEDVPSPGKYVEEPQVNVISQSTNVHNGDSNTVPGVKLDSFEAFDDEDSNGLVAPQPSVTSTDSLYKCSSLNWSANLDVNIDQLQEDLAESDDKDEDKNQKGDLSSTKGNDDMTASSKIPVSELQHDIETNRAPTPEITAQRYRSQTLNIALELIDDAEKNDNGKQTIEIKTKIYSSASTANSQVSKSVRSKAKAHKNIKGKKSRKSKTVATSDIASSKKKSPKRKSKHSDKATPADVSSGKMKDNHSKTTSSSKQTVEKVEKDKPSRNTSPSSKDNTTKIESKLAASTSKRSPDRSDKSRDRKKRNKEAIHSKHQAESDSHSSDRKKRSEDTSNERSKPSIFQRLSGVTKESSSAVLRLDSYKSRRSTSPKSRHSFSGELRGQQRRSYSPDDRHRGWQHGNRDDVGRSRSFRSDERSRHMSHDDRDARTYKADRHRTDPDYVSPKRYRSEWEPASKVITLKDPPSVVKTYDLVQTDSKRKGTKKRPVQLDEDKDKSPVRFPSPDIKVIDSPKSKKSKPPLVVLSDSD